MGKTLIIAEKPSVAGDIAKALGGFAKRDNYFESEQYVLSSAVGHLLELCVPEGHEVKRGKWSFANLPVIPPHFDLKPIEKTEDRLKLLTKLMKRKDVDRLINACDAGREGELIFRYIARYVETKKPIQRLWLQSMTPAAIRDGFAALRDDLSMRPLADAAVCRSESDWLVGINGTRAMTAFNSKTGGFHLTTVGRVQTPTLAIVVEREERIKSFVAKDYWEIHGTFDAKAGAYPGRWFDEAFSRDKDGDTDLKPERVWEINRAEVIRDKFLKEDWVKPNKRIFNNAKVSDHFAIIPTSLPPKHLHEDEAKLYDMVAKRFLAIFFPSAEFLVTTRITRVEGEPFKSEGKVMVQAGWLAIYGREAQTDETPSLVPVQPEETVQTTNVEVIANQTRPPARFNEATL